jgi:D-arabinose 1-dehydrogenase-like Zn-dependent alcohol dehydrogenase
MTLEQPSALEAARELGAEGLSMDELKEKAKTVKFHTVLDAVGLEATFTAAQELIAKNGKIVVMGLGSSASLL